MGKSLNHFIVFILSLSIFSCSTSPSRDLASTSSSSDLKQVRAVVDSLKAEILSRKIKSSSGDEYYDMTAYLGTAYTSMYFMSLVWTNDFAKDVKYQKLSLKFKDLLLKTQTKSGGWYRVLDVNLKDPADLSTTVVNYMFLKAFGEKESSSHMLLAKNYIQSHGSLEKTDLLTKIFLALFQSYSWDKIPKIPYLLFKDYSPVKDDQLAAWISPHILPLAILRKISANRFAGPLFSMNGFKTDASKIIRNQYLMSKADYKMVSELLKTQELKGSFGGYIIASIFSRMALSLAKDKKYVAKDVAKPIQRAQKFLDKYFFESGTSNFLGATQDGHIWDTALLTGALMDAGVKETETRATLEHVIKLQSKNGGFPFGYDFEKFPDVDDTAIVLSAASEVYNSQEPFIQKSLKYFKDMQNDDGGFAAFSKNNTGNVLLKYFTKPFLDTTDLFDESSPDVTAHVLESLGRLGSPDQTADVVTKSVKYLRKNQTPSGAFYGRWGVNYIYGTSAVLVGLKEIGMPNNDPMVLKGIQWLLSKQNANGGFGETTLSYSSKEWEGVGMSTPTQTAWALLALLKVLPVNHPSIKKSVDFLLANFKANNNTFVDQSVTGTGHPNVAYIVYPAYAKAFPLMALARYLRLRLKEN